MKIYVIMQKATEYNDEYDAPTEGAKIYKAFRNRPTEDQIKAAKFDAIDGLQAPYGEKWPDDMAYVEEIEVNEDQIIQAEESTAPIKSTGTYAEAQARAAAARVEAAELAKDAIHASAKAIFDQYPDLELFSWTQYTPYFNDGDECTFSVNADYPKVKIKGFDELEDGRGPVVMFFRGEGSDKVYVVDNDYSEKKVKFSYGRRGSSLVSGVKLESADYSERRNVEEKLIAEKKSEGYGDPVIDIKELLSSISEDDMKSVFGDHVEVNATPNGFEIEAYEHD